MSKRMFISLLLCALAFNPTPIHALGGVFAAPSGESESNNRHSLALERLRDGDDETAPDSMPALHEGIDDSSLEDEEDYQKWKRAFLRTQTGRALWSKYSRGFRLNIRMGENSGGQSGVEATDYVFTAGRLVGATIVLGVEFARHAPLNTAAYPILSSLSDNDNNISREARAIAFLAHEFGHVENARRIGGVVFQSQDQLLDQNEAGFIRHGRAWFSRPEYQQIVSELGATPVEVMRQREIGAEASAIQVIQDYFGNRGNMPTQVRQAIQNYQKAYPLSVEVGNRVVAEVQRILAFELDAELPRLSFGDWFEKVVGPGAGVTWQLCDCGDERIAIPNDIQACVEVIAILGDGRWVLLRMAVGTFKKGRIGSPSFSFGAVEWNRELHLVRRLRDLPKMLWAPGISANRSAVNNHPAIKLPGLNIPRITLAATDAYMAVAMAWNAEEISLPLTLEEPSPPEPPPPPDSVAPSKPPSVAESQSASGRWIQGAAIYKAQPLYPPNAKGFNASGQVGVRVTISEAGRVKEAVAVSGHPLLRDAAAAAARKWIFKPTTVNGVPVETRLVLTFDFSVPR